MDKLKFAEHLDWADKNDINVDDRIGRIFDFCLHMINELKPKNILCLGGYTNLDVFFATKDLDYAVDIVNVDPITDPNESTLIIKQKHKLIQEHFKFKGNYTWIKENADLKKVNNRKWDLIWDCGIFMNDQVKLIPKNQTLFYGHYSHPQLLYNELKQIDKITPIQAFSKSIAFYGNIQEHIKKIIWPDDPYRSGINVQTSKLRNNSEFFWPYNKKRVILNVASSKSNEWKKRYRNPFSRK